MRKLSFAICILGGLLGSNAAWCAEDTLVSWLNSKYNVSYALPPAEKSNSNANRVGVTHRKMSKQDITGGQLIQWQQSAPRACEAQNMPDFAGGGGVDTKNFTYKFDAGVTLRAEIKDIFTLTNLDISRLDEVELTLKEVKIAAPVGSTYRTKIEEESKDLWCKSNVFCASGKTEVISSVVEAKIDYKFHFKRNISLEAFQLTLSNITAAFGKSVDVGGSIKYITEYGKDNALIELTSNDKSVVIGMNTASVWDFVKYQDVCEK